MMKAKDKYTKSLIEACNEMRLDYFPQVEASELLYRVITLEDIYLPLSLSASSYSDPLSRNDSSTVDIEELIRRLDQKLAAVDALEARMNASDDSVMNETSFISKTQESNTAAPQSGLRLLIEANPGSGKTTFCKRLVLAMLKKDKCFFKKYVDENGLFFNDQALPVLISCKNISDLSTNELRTLSFPQLMYKLCLLSFGLHFSDITDDEFISLVGSHQSQKLCVILDGWDEILDKEKEAAFCENLNTYLELNPCIDTIITIRVSYIAPELPHSYSARYIIRPLSDNDIREFCRKWCEVILSPDQQRAKNYSYISDQILSSKDQQVRSMMKNPLDLSLLLTVSKNDGRLPENKAELFKELVDLYIYWSTNKSTGSLSAKTIRVFLSYIASIFTKNKKLYCDEDELLCLIRQAINDLEWTFSEDISCFDAYSIAKELSHTGIMTRTYDGKRFSFSESTHRTAHRQMQEYLTAYAILAQYSDEEYNNMSPIEIFEDKYEIRQWREVILFIALMNNGRLRQDLIKRLITKAADNPDNNYVYTNLLFDLIVNGADIRIADKHKIYDIVFSKHITDQQIANIISLVTNSNRSSADFIAYINAMFANSIKKGDSEYGYAQAVIEASTALQLGMSPFVYAKDLMQSDDDVSIVAGSQILIIMAWCKYANIVNAFSPYSTQYKMSSEWIGIFKTLIENQNVKTHLLKSIREAVLADFATFNDFFTVTDIENSCLQISESEKTTDNEIILSIVPVFDLSFSHDVDVGSEVKSKYLQKLNDEIERKEYDEIPFTFSICASMGCFTQNEKDEKWGEIDKVYKGLRGDGYIGKTRYIQLRKSLESSNLSKLMDHIASISSNHHELLSSTDYWELKERNHSYAIYSMGTEKMKIVFPSTGLSQDAKGFLDSMFPASIPTNNNLAYLLRRHELEEVRIGPDFNDKISPEQLLEGGIRGFDEFSVINYALSIADICTNEIGNYATGKEFLTSIKSSLSSDFHQWMSVVDWWKDLAVHRNEYEGLVVLTWLFTLGCLDVGYLDISDSINESTNHNTLRILSTMLQNVNSNSDDFGMFSRAILAILE